MDIYRDCALLKDLSTSGSSLAAAARRVVPAATAWLDILDLDEGAMVLSLPGS